VLSVRPKVTELVFQLYGRGLHPELFETFATRSIERGGYSALVSITNAGLILTEVATSACQPLPQKRRLLSYRLNGERSDRMECRGGASYQMCFQLERVDPDVFWTFQQELVVEGARHGLLHRFESAGRLSPGGLSWINIETRAKSLLVQAFHTFPDDLAIVKVQSLFEAP
jgi:hypothetical protein